MSHARHAATTYAIASRLAWVPLCACFAALALAVVEVRGAEPTVARPTAARWHIQHTANFRVLNYGPEPIDESLGRHCERLRENLRARWGLADSERSWHPKCDLVLHASDAGYDREVGAGGRSTVASALVDRRDAQISIRRIDVRTTRPDWQESALAHELTHVVVADRFSEELLPRWLDEGMAILADTAAKRRQHAVRAQHAVSLGRQFRLAELLLLADYPPADRWGAFYDQSAAFVEFLVAERGQVRFVEFVELLQTQGYDRAFATVYETDVQQLERRWHRWLTTEPRTPGAKKDTQTVAWAHASTGG